VSYLLDTCVISELVKPKPNRHVVTWIRSYPEEEVYLSAITIGEIQKGISKLTESKKKGRLQHWLDNDLMARFDRRIIGIDQGVARRWGMLLAGMERTGRPIPVIDGLIAASALVYNMVVVTRNTVDMEESGVTIHNPWAAS